MSSGNPIDAPLSPMMERDDDDLRQRLAARKLFDIFVSYAHADDEAPAGARYGWVTTLIEELKKLLRQKLGGAGADVWMDHRLAGNERVTETLRETVRGSRVLLLVMSRGYLRSDWCALEVDNFLAANEAHKNRESVFIVEADPTERSEMPGRLQSLTPIRFWDRPPDELAAMRLGYPVPSPGDRYWRQLNELAHLIAEHLLLLEPEAEAGPRPGAAPRTPALLTRDPARPDAATNGRPSTIPASPARMTVWVAEPTDDLFEHWVALVGALRQAGCDVLPPSADFYPRATEAEYLAALDSDIARAALLVQLLGPVAGRPARWAATSYPALQAAAAHAAVTPERPFLQWRPSELSLEKIDDPGYRALLTGAHASGLESFRHDVLAEVKRLLEPPPAPSTLHPQPAAGSALALCIQADSRDRLLGQELLDILERLGAEPMLVPEPERDQPPDEYRKHWESILLASDGVVIVRGRAPASWLQAQVMQTRKLLAPLRTRLWGALIDGPPPEKQPHGVRPHQNWRLFDCRDGISSDRLAEFYAELRGAGGA